MRKSPVIVAVANIIVGLNGSALAQPGESAGQEPPRETNAGDANEGAGVESTPVGGARGAEPSGAEPTEAEPRRGSPRMTPGMVPSLGPSGPLLFPMPGQDAAALRAQGESRPAEGSPSGSPSLEQIFAEDWWSHARPVFEFHGYFRTRAELFHQFALGRIDPPDQELFPQPSDNQYVALNGSTLGGTVGPVLCRADETDANSGDSPVEPSGLRGCRNQNQAGANMRFRLNPELHVSDNLRVVSQVDVLDNVVLGSTPEGYSLEPAAGGGYAVSGRSGYLASGYLDNTQVPPASGINGLDDSIRIKRAWGEYTTPLGELRFGRMPHHWGLGMVANAGDGYDDDAQSTIDRLMFASGIKVLDLVVGGMWDFPHEGPLQTRNITGFQAFDRAQLDDVKQWGFMLLRQKSPELTQLALSKDEWVVNTGLYVLYRSQRLANDITGSQPGADVPGASTSALSDNGFARRGLSLWQPDLWLQLRYKKLRLELEAAAIYGELESPSVVANNSTDFNPGEDTSLKLRQFGFAFELQQKLVEDRLRLNFNAGFSSGDGDALNPNAAGNLTPGVSEQQINDDTVSTFRFHPSYRVDRILQRYILGRVQGTYYFAPNLEYDFTREPNGQRIGGGVGAVWTRASEPVQTPGHAADLGLELNGGLYFQSKDGAVNDAPDRLGGFYGRLDYAALFPLEGLGYPAGSQLGIDTEVAQMLRLYLGVLF